MKKFDNYHEYMKYRLDRRVKVIRDRADKVMARYVELRTDKIENASEDDRLWLDQFANGKGLDICCGDFLIGGDDQASGVDGDTRMVGTDYLQEGDELSWQTSGDLDFVVTNYLDGLPNPLNALNEWWRVLKAGGTLALICRDADSYPDKYLKGALSNGSRQNTYTKTTLKHYLYRAGFIDVVIKGSDSGSIRAHAKKEQRG